MTILPHVPVVFSMVCVLLSCGKPGVEGNWWKGISAGCSGFARLSEITRPAIYLKRPPAKPRYPLEKKKLKVLTLHSINSFFLYDGEEYGLEYELLQLYAKHADMAVDIVTVENYKQMYDSMSLGDFDLAMGTLFVNKAMDTITPFSNTLYHSDVILATLDVKIRIRSGKVSPSCHSSFTASFLDD